MDPIDPRELGKLRWRCRRGMRELDELLTRYVDEQYPRAAPAIQAAFRELLEGQDTLIHAYCLGGRRPPTAELSALIEQITGDAAYER